MISKVLHKKLRTQLKTGGDLVCTGRVSSSCFSSDTHRVIVIEYEISVELQYT